MRLRKATLLLLLTKRSIRAWISARTASLAKISACECDVEVRCVGVGWVRINGSQPMELDESVDCSHLILCGAQLPSFLAGAKHMCRSKACCHLDVLSYVHCASIIKRISLQ